MYHRKQTLALTLAVLMTAASAIPASAAPIDSGVVPTYDEAYYATLDYYGNLLEGSVVKSYALNGADRLTDYGVYDEVVNLTDSAPVTLGEGTASFQFSQTPGHFYFEGKTGTPFRNLPWTVTLRYTLNGVPIRAEELAGQKGVVEIAMDVVPNRGASAYARYNYTLEAMAMFNQDDILSLEAPGAQVQLVGNLRTVLFMCLPGEEQHFTIRVGSDDFSFDGMTILMVPATLSQLQEIAKLSQRKDDLEKDYKALSGSLDALLDALNDVQDGLNASASGLDRLDTARGTISAGKNTLYGDAGVLRGDLSNIADLLEPVEQRALALSQTITGSKAVLNEMADTAVSLQTQLKELEDALEGLEDGSGDVRRVVRGLADMKSSLRSLQHALGDTHIGSGGGGSTSMTATVNQVKSVHAVYESTGDAFLAGMLKLSGKTATVEEVRGLQRIPDLETFKQAQAAGATGSATEEDWKSAKALEQMEAAKGGMSFQKFCEQLPGVDKDTAKQMNDLWTVYSSGPVEQTASEPAGQAETAEETPDASSAETEEETLDASSAETSAAGLALTGRFGVGRGIMAGALAGGSIYLDAAEMPSEAAPAPTNAPASDSTSTPSADPAPDSTPAPSTNPAPGSTPDPSADPAPDSTPAPSTNPAPGSTPDPSADPTPDSTPAPSTDSTATDSTAGGSAASDESQTVGGAAVDLIVGGLDNAMSQANARINAIQSELNSTLNKIARPTGRVVGELADLCDDVDSLVYLIDHAEDLAAAVRQSSGKIQSILGSIGDLQAVLNEYEPILQEGIANMGALSTSASTSLRNLETLLADAETLMKTSGNQLDDGTRQALRGLSATLRQTAKAMAATSDVRDAKATINSIIEDTWNEYTGDINNILMMDAEAEAVSLTDPRNPAPSSVQILIRTQEIKEQEPELTAATLAVSADGGQTTTFWGRVAQMFKDFWKAVTGIFH